MVGGRRGGRYWGFPRCEPFMNPTLMKHVFLTGSTPEIPGLSAAAAGYPYEKVVALGMKRLPVGCPVRGDIRLVAREHHHVGVRLARASVVMENAAGRMGSAPALCPGGLCGA